MDEVLRVMNEHELNLVGEGFSFIEDRSDQYSARELNRIETEVIKFADLIGSRWAEVTKEQLAELIELIK